MGLEILKWVSYMYLTYGVVAGSVAACVTDVVSYRIGYFIGVIGTGCALTYLLLL